jgi:large subunit ribosomal protein L19
MNNKRLQLLAQHQSYHILPVRSGMQLELHEKVGEGTNQRIWKMKGLVLKVKRPNHVDGTFTIRGKTSGLTIEKIYPLSFLAFDKVLLLDTFKIRRAKLYYLRDKVGKDARLKSLITADERGIDLLVLAKEAVAVQEEILGVAENETETQDIITETTITKMAVSEEEVTITEETLTVEDVVSQEGEVVEETITITKSSMTVETPSEQETTQEETIVPEEIVENNKETNKEDDIIVIDGIGPKFKERLAEFGIITLSDLVDLTDERIAEIEASDAMTSLEEWKNWIDQAKARLA